MVEPTEGLKYCIKFYHRSGDEESSIRISLNQRLEFLGNFSGITLSVQADNPRFYKWDEFVQRFEYDYPLEDLMDELYRVYSSCWWYSSSVTRLKKLSDWVQENLQQVLVDTAAWKVHEAESNLVSAKNKLKWAQQDYDNIQSQIETEME